MAMPSTPFVIRSSMIRFCSAAVPSDVRRNSAEPSVRSLSAFSTPWRAIVQKSAELLVTNASLSCLVSVLELQDEKSNHRAKIDIRRNFLIGLSPFCSPTVGAVYDRPQSERLRHRG